MKKSKCLYCNKEFEYENYKSKTCSKECAELLRKKTNLKKYGVENPTQIKESSNKRIETIKQKYGSGKAPLKKPITRVCNTCGKEYQSTANFSMYCSDKCKKNKPTKVYDIPLVKSNCIICGKEFEYKSNSKKNTCSKECRKILREQTNLEKYGVKNVSQRTKENGKEAKTLTCKECGKEFKSFSNYQLYCSKECRLYKTIKCIICNKEFKTLRTRNGKTCSDECKQKLIERTNVEKYGFKRALQNDIVKKKSIQTYLDKYGVENPMLDEDIKNKLKETNIQKRGVDNPFKSKEVQDQIKQTNLNKYGVEYPMRNEDILKKARKTCLEKYETEWASSSPQIRNRVEQTNLDKYNVTNPMKLEEIQKIQQENCMKKFGVSYYCLTDNCINAQGHTISKLNKEIASLFEIDEFEFRIKDRSYDLKKNNILIEINPSYTHNSTIAPTYKGNEGRLLDKKYHYNKTKLAIENGYRCIHVWDWDDLDKIKMMLDDKKSIYARSLELKELDQREANKFLDLYHLQGAGKGQKICLGLYKNDELIQIMTFGKPRYNKNYQYELIRLCTDSKYKIIGGSERLFKYFIKEYNPESIISYCDNSKFSGEVYSRIGFNLKSYGVPTCHWYNSKTKRHILDSSLRMRGYSLLHKDENYEKAKKGDDNRTLMIEDGYVEVYDCGQSVYIWDSSKN